ncbi:hypothetical protein HOA91_03460 [Candidatus Woesearchaeota archaeon]|jgi:uncharacterized membrane protein|nr:hypothetical protein [Candidatus Woesearchaeota archaeon]
MNLEKNKKKVYLILFLIVILGATLRFYDLSTESLWTDEMVSLIHTQKENYKGLIDSVIYTELMPPGYFITLKYWASLFGTSEFSLRFLSAFFDSLSVILIYLLGAKVFNKKVGLISALIFSTTMLQIVYAQEARPYALFGFLVLLSTYLFILLSQTPLNKRKKIYFLFGYSLVNAILLYTNYMALFVIIFHSLILFFYYREHKSHLNLKNHFSSAIISIIFFIPGLQILFIQTMIRHPILQESLVLRGVPVFLSNLGVGFYLLPLILLLLFTIGILVLFRKYSFKMPKNNTIIWVTFVSLAFIGIIHLFLMDTITRSFALVRHSFFIIPFFYVLVAKVISLLKLKRTQIIIVFLILIFNFFTLTLYYGETTKAPWDEAVITIKEHSSSKPLILFDRSGSNVLLFDYYWDTELYRGYDQIKLTWENKRELIKINESQLFSLLNQKKEFWLISSRNIKTGDYYVKLLKDKYNLIYSESYKELDLYYYNSKI